MPAGPANNLLCAAVPSVVYGPAVINWNGVELGISEDGVPIVTEPKFLDIYSDDFGGRSGVPADRQFLGAIARIIVRMPKFNRVFFEGLSSWMNFNTNPGSGVSPAFTPTAGLVPRMGSLVRNVGVPGTMPQFEAQLQIVSSSRTFTFANAHVFNTWEVNVGSRYAIAMAGFECWYTCSITDLTPQALFTTAATAPPA